MNAEREKEIRDAARKHAMLRDNGAWPSRCQELLAALDECRRERGIVLTHDELIALASALDAIAATPVVPDLEVYYAAVQKIMAAELAAR